MSLLIIYSEELILNKDLYGNAHKGLFLFGTRILAYGEDSHTLRLTSELVDLRAANANLILCRFARRASLEATSAAANAKRTPEGVLCVV